MRITYTGRKVELAPAQWKKIEAQFAKVGKLLDGKEEKEAHVVAHDPVAIDRFKAAYGGAVEPVTFVRDWRNSVAGADVIIIATAWAEYRELAEMNLTGKVLFDARRMFDPSTITSGSYLSIGRRIATPR